jgi:sua5/yciO/yrdC/ywlC family protein
VLGDDVPRSGVSSTIVDCTHEHPHILRVGALTADDFKELL